MSAKLAYKNKTVFFFPLSCWLDISKQKDRTHILQKSTYFITEQANVETNQRGKNILQVGIKVINHSLCFFVPYFFLSEQIICSLKGSIQEQAAAMIPFLPPKTPCTVCL